MKVTFFQNKVDNTVENPLNTYTDSILKPLEYMIPVLHRVNTHKPDQKAKVSLLEDHYRALLQTIGQIINFDREVVIDTEKHAYATVKSLFNPYFSRKTFCTILDDLDIDEHRIALFTGHKIKNATELSSSYIHRNTIAKKAALISVLKVGPNPYST
jgi:hypothetical protein